MFIMLASLLLVVPRMKGGSRYLEIFAKVRKLFQTPRGVRHEDRGYEPCPHV
jgi:hypothetical protein